MRAVVPLVLATFLLAQTGCSSYSENHRHGLMYGGGALTLMGAIIAADGAYCDDSGNGGDCESGDDRRNLVSGLIMAGVGLGLFGVAYFTHPKAQPAP
jgi:hypothetical protein